MKSEILNYMKPLNIVKELREEFLFDQIVYLYLKKHF